MLRNYFKIALRNLLRFKGYSTLNTLGLAVGIAASLLIVQHLRDELSFDQQHRRLDQLYRIGTSFTTSDKTDVTAMSPSPMAWTLVQDYPEVEQAARLLKPPMVDKHLFKYQGKSFFEQKGYLVDSTFFRLLKFDFLNGNAENALNEPNTVVLSHVLAAKIFGAQNPLNQTITIGDPFGEYEFKVTGVIDAQSLKSHIDGNFYMNIRSTAMGQRFHNLPEWAGNNLFYTYVRLRPDANVKMFETKLAALVEAKAGERLRTLGFRKEHFLEPVRDIYLHSATQYPIGPSGDMSMVWIFGAIAVFILLIACINFMNLATAKATLRAKEVGVRKVIGASRGMLIQQFMSESVLLSMVAVGLAIVGAKLALPYFNQVAGKTITLPLGSDPALLAWMAGITLFTALAAGSYPALFLSRFNPVSIFRGKTGNRFSAQQVRRGLVVLQFIISIALIQGILVVQQQLDYVQNKNLGFEKDARLVVQLNTTKAIENFKTLQQAFEKQADVIVTSGTNDIPGGPNIEDMLFYAEGKSPEENVHSNLHFVSPEYLPTLQFQVLAGRLFDKNRSTDSTNAAVISEEMMRGLGYSLDNAVGKHFYSNWNEEVQTQEIIGVVRDFHASSLHSEIGAHSFFWDSDEQYTYLVASVSTEDLRSLVPALEQDWQSINPGEPFEYYFLDDKLQQAYLSEQRTAQLISAFTMLALFISCLGLFGLAAFAAESRAKEIGVRKVLGASVGNIISLLSTDFVRLILIALVIATPLAWYVMNLWLLDFHYRISMPWWAFALAGLVAMAVAVLTVSGQSLKAALANPVNSLRSE